MPFEIKYSTLYPRKIAKGDMVLHWVLHDTSYMYNNKIRLNLDYP